MTPLDDVVTFAAKAEEFSKQMSEAADFTELLGMWRSTSFPYVYAEKDPHSDAYRKEVEQLYQALTNISYSVENELTSNKLADAEFETGFPWTTKNLSVIWPEMAKVVQAIRELDRRSAQGKRVIEFGAGWGNLAIPLAKSGLDVSVVDIDKGFLQRIDAKAKLENISIETIQGDFIAAARGVTKRYSVVMFQASFHHCLEFEYLLQILRDDVLDKGGFIIFGSEPIYEDYPLPWGLRFDGESIWAITDKKWLELGFSEAFFFDLLLRNGYFARRVENIPTVLSEAWAADLGSDGIELASWRLPPEFDQSFHDRRLGDDGRFCRDHSILPGLIGGHHSSYEFHFANFSGIPLGIEIRAGGAAYTRVLAPGEQSSATIEAKCAIVEISSDTFCPADLGASDDDRILGVYISRIAMSGHAA